MPSTEWLRKHEDLEAHVCLEATEIYREGLTIYLFEADRKISVINPAQTKGFAQSELTCIKTDKTNSQSIARFFRAISPHLWKSEPVHIRELQAWARRLEGL